MRQNPKRRSLARQLSRCGIASRNGAADLIRGGHVTVNGKIVREPDHWIETGRDKITVDGHPVESSAKTQLVIFNKPRGVVVTESDEQGRETVRDRLPEPYRSNRALRTVGRLDRASGGLLLLTNDNDLAAAITDRQSELPKFYRVKVSPVPDSSALHRLRIGVFIGEGEKKTLPARVSIERKAPKSAVVRIAITEGRNRQIRRMAKAVGCEVEWLVRVAIGPIELEDLGIGEAREANAHELDALRACLER